MKQILFALMVLAMFSCKNKGPKIYKDSNDNSHQVVVVEAIQSSQYTYLKVTENGQEQWLAVTSMDAKAGDTFYFDKSLEMSNFHSKELNRDFETIQFVDKLSSEPVTAENKGLKVPPGSSSVKIAKQDIKIEAAKDGITLADLFSKKDSFNGKIVVIKGQIVKYSPEIMNKNWFHIQDGTESAGKFDLTGTTMTTLKVGDIVTIEGKVALNKDFGYGYFYDVIIEDAIIK
jgi:hypothetical protein